MGSWIPGNPSGTLDSGQCCRTSIDWRRWQCVEWEQKVEYCWSSWGASSLQDDDSKGVGGTAHPTRSMMMPTMIDGLSGVLQYTVVKEDIPGLLPLSFQEKQTFHISEQLFLCIAHKGSTAR